MAAEDPLWKHLDACGIGFRLSRAELVSKHGSIPSPWLSDQQECHIEGSRPFIEGLANPLMFQFGSSADLQAHETQLAGYVRLRDDVDENLAVVQRALESLFGEGQGSSVSNTKALQWRFGRAVLTATVFPPELNESFGSNRRHERIAGSATECSISIDTGYVLPLSDREREWLLGYRPLWKGGSDNVFDSALSRLWPDDLDKPLEGYGFSAGGEVLIQVSKELVNFLARDRIVSVGRSTLLPARGSGGDYLYVRYRDRQSELPTKNLYFVSKHGEPHGLKKTANALAAELGLKLETDEANDC